MSRYRTLMMECSKCRLPRIIESSTCISCVKEAADNEATLRAATHTGTRGSRGFRKRRRKRMRDAAWAYLRSQCAFNGLV